MLLVKSAKANEKINKLNSTINKSEKKLSVTSLITEKNKDNNLIVIDDFEKEIKKTKELFSIVSSLKASNSLLLLDKSSKKNIFRSSRNIPNIKVTDINHFSSYDITKYKKLLLTLSSIKELEKKYS